MELLPSDARQLSYAIGWIGLGNWWEAHQELADLAPSVWLHPDVLLIRHEIYAKTGAWNIAADLAVLIMDLRPQDPNKWLALAQITLNKPDGGLPEAKGILRASHDLFPKDPMIPYRLSCYECRSGNLEQARFWLDKAFAVGNQKMLTMMALVESDLASLADRN